MNPEAAISIHAASKTASDDASQDVKIFGFWIYLMTDLVIFAALFAAFAVLRANTFGGPSGRDLYHLPSVLVETLALLTSSFTCTLAMLGVHTCRKRMGFCWFIVTFVLGILFLVIELREFSEFIHKGASWQRSAYLSSFFTLVGTHGFHISVGLLWMIVEMFRIMLRPLSEHNISKMWRMALFWHFLDFVWIFIFSVVYGMEYLL